MWTPKEVRKLIAQCAGVLFGIGGILLMVADVKATGKINLSSNIISGEIESGSAGLLLIFFAFFLVLLPALHGRHSVTRLKKNPKTNSKSKLLSNNKKNILITLISAGLTTLFFICAEALGKNGYASFSSLLMVGGYCFGAFTGVMIFGTIYEFYEPEQEKKEDENK